MKFAPSLFASLPLTLLSLIPLAASPAHAADPPAEKAASSAPYKFGVDLYYGFSNIVGYRRYDDHMWGGYGGFVPSTVYATYENERGIGAKIAVGTGDLFNVAGDEFYQPAEAWVKSPLGKTSTVTVGKFWVPLAVQEWEYESKPGVMLETSRKNWGLSVAATHNRARNTGNFYSRLSHNWGEKATVGLSLNGGKGVTFDSDHDRGIGLDGRVFLDDWEIYGELLRFKAGSAGRFDFVFGKVAYHGWKKWTPFALRTTWNDALGQQGSFRSTAVGISREINANLSVETAYARVGGLDKWWTELHFAWEK